jgi:hypothetical protein
MYYFCGMIKKTYFILIFFLLVLQTGEAQQFFKTVDLFRKPDSDRNTSTLNIFQEPNVDTLISRYILMNKKLEGEMEGFRIQIFRSSNRNAKDEYNKVRAEFMIEFPDIASYAEYQEPGYFIVKAGDFRTRLECTKLLYLIRKKFPNAYPVPSKIKFPDLNKN